MVLYVRYKGPPAPPSAGPTNTTAPTISGTAMENSMLVLVQGRWTYTEVPAFPKPIYSWQWTRNGVNISGATDPVYWLTSADVGAVIACKESAQDSTGTATVAAAATATVVADTRTVVTMASLGLKTSQTTGSISSGATSLEVASGTGFSIGDKIIVEIGTESGLGQRGTMGVGGTWPALKYADATARNADTSQANGTFAWIETDGSIHSFNGSTWSPYSTTDYYHAKAQPLSLLATISNIAGNVLTLDTTAKATATNANVYFDNAALLGGTVLNGSNNPSNWSKVFTFGSGTYAFSDQFQPNLLRDCWFKGAGKASTKLLSPKGVPSLQIRFEQCQRCRVSDLEVAGNLRDHGFGLRRTSQTTQDRANSFMKAVWFKGGSYNGARDLKISDAMMACVSDFGTHNWGKSLEVVSTEGQQIYIQWQLMWADSFGGGSIDCSVVSPYALGGIEMFRSERVSHIRFTSTNGFLSTNTAGDFLYDKPIITVTNLSQKNASFVPPVGFPIVNINSNIGNTSSQGLDLTVLGGEVRNPTIVMQGFINANKQLYTGGIVIAPAYKKADGSPSVLIRGGYPNNPSAGGLIQLPNYETPINGAADSNGPVAIKSDGTAWIVGIRAVGQAKTPTGTQYNNLNFASQSVPNGYVYNSVADTIRAGFTSGNQTNAEYLAGGGT